jgi:diguanylate cyclase (GGDEF)-like protein
VKLSVRTNYILLPIISAIFAAGGFLSYQAEKSFFLESLQKKLMFESQVVADSLEHEYMALDSMTIQFLNNVEVTRYLKGLDGTDAAYSVYVSGHRLLQSIKDISQLSGQTFNIEIVDKKGRSVYYYNADDPFAKPSPSNSLMAHMSSVSRALEDKSSLEVNLRSYEVEPLADGRYSVNIYRTFCLEHALNDPHFSLQSPFYTVKFSRVFDAKNRFELPIQETFDQQTSIALDPQGLTNDISDTPNISLLSPRWIRADHSLLSTEIKVSDGYISSVLMDVKTRKLVMSSCAALFSFLLLKILIYSQIIRPVVRLTTQVDKAIQGDEHALQKLTSRDEVSLLNNNYIKLFDDISDMAKKDSLTGLANRAAFSATLQRAIEASVNDSEMCALFYMDLDNFKNVNDTYGHPMGDQVLIDFSQKLVDCFRVGDLISRPHSHGEISRLAGDEFAVMVPNVPDIDTVARVAERIVAICDGGFEVAGIVHDVKISVGIAVSPNDAVALEELVKCADIAMYQVKKNGKNDYCFYSDVPEDAPLERV